MAYEFVIITSGSGNWTVPAGVTSIDVLRVGGGGGGRGRLNTDTSMAHSGGGAGGVLIDTNVPVTPADNIPYSIGEGGAGGSSGNYAGAKGEDTQFGSLADAIGGGGGHRNNTSGDGSLGNGGSGGGNSSTTNGTVGGTSTSGQGQNGGTSASRTTGANGWGAGGGGYTTAGTSASGSTGGEGGTGLDISTTIFADAIALGCPAAVAGGGTGGRYFISNSSSAGKAGGYGGGGAGGAVAAGGAPQPGGNGAANTGGGGGGAAGRQTSAGASQSGGNGGSGLIVIRYQVDDIIPNTGDIAGGTAVTINGTGFTSATGVTFGGVAATSVVVVNDSEITCVTPAHSIGAVDVVVQRPSTDITFVNGFTYTSSVPVPTLVSITPNEGVTTGGEPVTLTGDNLTGATGVEFDGVAATNVVVVDDETITCDTPAHAVGAIDVKVLHPDGDAILVSGFTYTEDSKPVRVTQIPVSILEIGNRPVRVTQIPIMVAALPIQAVRVTQIPINVPVILRPVPFPAPIVPELPLTETWDWLTTVVISENGKEQRNALRETPRRTIAFDTLWSNYEEYRRAFDLQWKQQGRFFNWPWYQYGAIVARQVSGNDTLTFDPTMTDLRVGEVAALFDPVTVETHYVTVASLNVDGCVLSEPLDFDIEYGWQICPAPSHRMPTPGAVATDSISGTISFAFEHDDRRSLQRIDGSELLTTYSGNVVLDKLTLAGISDGLDRNTRWTDHETSKPLALTKWLPAFASGQRAFSFNRYASGAQGSDYWRAFMDRLKGRRGTFLMPSWADDLPLIEVPALNATQLVTSRIQAEEYLFNKNVNKFVRIESQSGVIYRKVNDQRIQYDMNGNPVSMRLMLNAGIGAAAGSNIIGRISFCGLTRLDSDSVTLTHGPLDTTISFAVRQVNE